jgi:uncharacterized protein (TIGR03084 family)
MPDLAELCTDLAAEHEDLDALVARLDAADFDRPTPAEGFLVRDQLSHLAYFDEAAARAVTDPAAFRAQASALASRSDPMEEHLERGRSLEPAALLRWWREARRAMLDVFARLDPSARVVWFGPDMGAASFVTARLMETFAHGQDIADALEVERPPTARLRHVAYLGYRTLRYSFAIRGLPEPVVPVRVELAGPSGESWAFGEAGAADLVRGPVLDFCLVVTQRRHLDDTELVVEGPVASQWMRIAQAFAGPPGPGRKPRRESGAARGTDR